MKKILYIYRITNKINGKKYIGKHSSNSLDNNYFGSGVAIKKAIKKYCVNNFVKEIICTCRTESELNEMEIFHIENEKTFLHGYNMTKGGEGKLGFKQSEASIKKASESRRLFYINNPEARKKISLSQKKRIGNLNPFFGKKLSIEHIEKMRVARVLAITGGNNPSARKVVCVESGKKFETAKDAAASVGLAYSTTILKCAKGQAKSAGGFTWEFYE